MNITIYTKEEMTSAKEAGMATINRAQNYFNSVKARNVAEIPGFQEIAELCGYFWIPDDGNSTTAEVMKYFLEHCKSNPESMCEILNVGGMVGFPFDTEGEGILFLAGITRADFEEKAEKFWVHYLEMTNEALLTEIESTKNEKALNV